MNELLIFGELHKFLNSICPMILTVAEKSLSIGYKPRLFARPTTKFATLYGDKKYRCLIIHVDPGNPESVKGKKIQKEIQDILTFDIKEMRNIGLKKHEVYIPFDVVDSKEKLTLLKDFIQRQYYNCYAKSW